MSILGGAFETAPLNERLNVFRYGNLKNGVSDIKFHEFFQLIDWQAIYDQRMEAPYAPIPVHDVRHLLETASGYTDDPKSPQAKAAEFEFF